MTAGTKLRHSLLGRKAMTNLDCILKSCDITLHSTIHIVTAMVFPLSCMNVSVGPEKRLSAEELILLNCSAGKDSSESLGQ